MHKIKTLILDDELPAINELKYNCEKYIEPDHIFTMQNPTLALDLIKNEKIKLVFLDINMPYISGLDLAKQITDLPNPPHIIFVTAYDEHALKAFELNALDYILKPIEPARFAQTISKIQKNTSSNKRELHKTNDLLNGKITAFGTSLNDRYIFNLSDICFFQSEGPIVFAHTKDNQNKRVQYQLQQLEKNLPANFLRTHKSYIINMDYVSRIYLWQKSNYMIELNCHNYKIPVSRRYSSMVKEKLNW